MVLAEEAVGIVVVAVPVAVVVPVAVEEELAEELAEECYRRRKARCCQQVYSARHPIYQTRTNFQSFHCSDFQCCHFQHYSC